MLYLDGFMLCLNSDEDDYVFFVGVCGECLLDVWYWDLSSGYGVDCFDIGMIQLVNVVIYCEIGNSLRSFDLVCYCNS